MSAITGAQGLSPAGSAPGSPQGRLRGTSRSGAREPLLPRHERAARARSGDGEGEAPKSLDAQILGLALPALGTLAIDPLLSVVDTGYVGHLGTAPLAALGAASSLFTFTFLLFNFLSQATAPLVGQALGRADEAAARRTVAQAVTLAALCGALSLAALEAFAEPLLRAVYGGGEAEAGVLALAATYVRVRALGLPAALVSNALGGAYRGLLDTRTPLRIALVANAANALLDPVLIFGVPGGPGGLGVAGAAAATVAAEYAACWQFLRGLGRTRLGGVGGAELPRPAELLPLLTASGALLARQVALQGTLLLAASTAARVADGGTALAAHQVSIQAWMLLSFTFDSVAVAAQGLVSDSLGRGDRGAARAVAGRCLAWGAGLGAAGGAGLWGAHGWLSRAFSSAPDVQAASESTLGLYVAAAQPVNALVFVGDGVIAGSLDFVYVAGGMGLAALVAGGSMVLREPSLEHVWQSLTALMAVRGGVVLTRVSGRFGGPLAPDAADGDEPGASG